MANQRQTQTRDRSDGSADGDRVAGPDSVNDFRVPILYALALSPDAGLTVRQLELQASALANEARWLADDIDVRFDFDLEALIEEGLVVLESSKRLRLSPVAVMLMSDQK